MNGPGLFSAESRKIESFIDSFRKSLATRLAGEEPAGVEPLLRQLAEALAAEEATGRQHQQAVAAAIAAAGECTSAADFTAAAAGFRTALADQFAFRPSVAVSFTQAAAFHDRLFAVACDLAGQQSVAAKGKKLPLLALLASGRLGQQEAIDTSGSSLLLLLADDCAPETGRAAADALREMLGGCFPTNSDFLWSGTLAEWADHARPVAGPAEHDDTSTFARQLALLADSRLIAGNPEFGAGVVALNRQLLAAADPELFRLLATATAAKPVGLGMFGRFRTLWSGPHKGTLPIRELAIEPIVDVVRLLAVAGGFAEQSTMGRLRRIMANGQIGVTLADNIAAAFIDFERELIGLALRSRPADDEFYLAPEELAEDLNEQLRTGLEYVTTMQRVAYQILAEPERR